MSLQRFRCAAKCGKMRKTGEDRRPLDVSSGNYRALVLYDSNTRALLDNGQPFPSVALNQRMTIWRRQEQGWHDEPSPGARFTAR